MININTNVGQVVGVSFTDTTGLVSFPSLVLLTDSGTVTPGQLSSLGTAGLSIPVELVGTGVYGLTFSPLAIGNYYILYLGVIIAHIQVASHNILDIVRNLEDEALGSWSWNKTTGILTLLRQAGTTMATYEVVDTTLTSSRNRLS